MRDWAELQQEPSEDPSIRQLASAIETLCNIHSKHLSDEGRRHWIKQLTPWTKTKSLWKALEAAGNERGMPPVIWVLEQQQKFARDDVPQYVPPPEPTPEERMRSDRAAILSMLWLEYTKGFGPVHIGGIVNGCMARIFARQTGKSDSEIEASLAEARAKYPREFVLRWMEEQKAMGN